MFDVLVSAPGFNKYDRVFRNISAEDLGPALVKIMSTYEQSHYKVEGSKLHPTVMVHLHPTYFERFIDREI